MAKALTSVSIEKLKPAKARREIPDARMPGLYLVIQPSGSKSWAVRYRLGGRSKKYTIGGYPAFDLIKARKRASDAIQAAAEGQDPCVAKRKAREAAKLRDAGQDTFASIARLFISRHAQAKNRSWKEAARLLGLRPDPENPGEFTIIKKSIVDRWSKRHIAEITKRDIIDILDEIIDRGAGTLANRTQSQLRKLFNWCVEKDILASSPCAGVKAQAKEESRDRILSDDEIRWLWKAAEAQEFPFGPLTKVLLLTGQRRGEVAGMARTELNAAKDLWSILKERTKNGEPHDVPISNDVKSILESVPRIAGSGLVFTQTGLTPVSGFSRAKRKLDKAMLKAARKDAPDAEKITIEPWTLHDLRRTCASGMAALRVPPHIVEAVLNHRSGTIKGVAAVYNRYQYDEEKRAALDAWARRVDEIVTGKASNVLTFMARA